jgi:hypothetical protein
VQEAEGGLGLAVERGPVGTRRLEQVKVPLMLVWMKSAGPWMERSTWLGGGEVERNQADSTFGWGIVFSDKTMDGFRQDDPRVVAEIERNFHHWDNVDVFFKDRRITSGGHGFCGIGRLKLLQIFQARARELGVSLKFETEFRDPDDYAREYDLVIGADGVNSTTRGKYPGAFQSPHRGAQVPFHLAGHQDEAECLHLCLQADRMGLVQPPCLPVQRGMGHLHRRNAGGNLAQGRPRPDGTGPVDRLLRETSLPTC